MAEITKENEILITKLYALEHSITELADRTLTTQISHTSQNLSSSAILNSSTSSDSLHHQLELKDLRAKITNLQFDLREKETEIETLKSIPNDPSFSNARTLNIDSENLVAKFDDERERYKHEIECLKKDISRLQLESTEADTVGRSYLEQFKSLQKELIAQKQLSGNYEEKLEELKVKHKQDIDALQTLQSQKDAELEAKNAQIENSQKILESMQSEAEVRYRKISHWHCAVFC